MIQTLDSMVFCSRHPAPPSHLFGCGGAPCTNRPEHCVGSAAGQTRRKFSGFTARILLPSPAPSASCALNSRVSLHSNIFVQLGWSKLGDKLQVNQNIQCVCWTNFEIWEENTQKWWLSDQKLGVQIPTVGSSERFGGYRFQSLHHRNPSCSAVITNSICLPRNHFSKGIHSLKLTVDSSPLKIVISNRNFLFHWSIFRGYPLLN